MSEQPNLRDVASELLRRSKARDSLTYFREYMASTGHLDFMHPPAAHHQLMIHHLDRLYRGDINRLMILAPPGSAKSTYSGIQFPVKYLCYKPHENIICASNTQDLATSFNRRRLNAALSPEWMMLSGTKLDKNMQSMEHFGTEKQGSIKAVGVTTAVVGNRSHLNILDDPIRGVEEAYSIPILDKQWAWFNEEFRTRLVPGGKELIVSTRWARKDIAGRILERVDAGEEQWTVLRLPMLADRVDDPMGRALGENLWPDYFTTQLIVEKMRSQLMWSTQYQQTPLDEKGAWVSYDNLKFVDPPNIGMKFNFVIAMDLALSIDRGDYTVFVVAAIDCFRNIWIMHVDRMRASPADTVARLVQLCKEYEYGDGTSGISEVLIDDDNSSKVFKTLLHEVYRNERFSPPPINAIPMRGHDKQTRAAAIRSSFHMGNVKIVKAKWNNDLMKECLEFPSGEHDDIVDALGLIGRRLPMLSAPPKPLHLSGEDPQKNSMVREVLKDGQLVPHLNMPLEELFADRDTFSRRRNRL